MPRVARLRLNTQLDSESYWYRGGSAPERRMLHGYVPFVSIFFVPPSVPVASWKVWVCRGFRGFATPAERGHPLRY